MPFVSPINEELSRNLGISAILKGFANPVCWALSPPPKISEWEYLLPLGVSGATRNLNFKCSRQQPRLPLLFAAYRRNKGWIHSVQSGIFAN